MDKFYPGNAKIDGSVFDVSAKPNEERRPFSAILDIGLVRTTVGNRVFGALKGATDGGLYVPHNEKRFPGYSVEDEKRNYDIKAHRERIFGVHIDKYIAVLKKKGEDQYTKQFSQWDKTLKASGSKSVEDLFKKVHEEIKKNSDRVKKGVKKDPKRDHKKFKNVRLNAK